MKRSHVLILVVVLLLQAPMVFADAIDDLVGPLENDLETVLAGIGSGLVPNLQQVALSANIVGDAEIGRFPHFSLSLAGVGVNVFDGVGTFLTEQALYDPGALLSIPELAEESLREDPDDENSALNPFYVLATEQAVPIPSFKVGLGFGLARGYELLLSGLYIPTPVLDLAKSFIPEDSAGPVENLTLGIDNYSVRLRKVILGKPHRRGRSLSLGLGYTYAGFGIDYELSSLLQLDQEIQEVGGFWADVDGAFNINTRLHSVGMDIHTARRWPLLTTFLKISPYYSWARFRSTANLNAYVIRDDPGEPTLDDVEAIHAGVAAEDQKAINIDTDNVPNNSRLMSNDLSVHVNSGFEIRLLGIIFHTSVGFNLEDPIADIASLDFGQLTSDPESAIDQFDGSLNGLNLNVGLRMQY